MIPLILNAATPVGADHKIGLDLPNENAIQFRLFDRRSIKYDLPVPARPSKLIEIGGRT